MSRVIQKLRQYGAGIKINRTKQNRIQNRPHNGVQSYSIPWSISYTQARIKLKQITYLNAKLKTTKLQQEKKKR